MGRHCGGVLPDPHEQPTVSVPEAAHLLGVSAWTLYEAIKRDQSPVRILRVGKKIRVQTVDLLRVIGMAAQVEPSS